MHDMFTDFIEESANMIQVTAEELHLDSITQLKINIPLHSKIEYLVSVYHCCVFSSTIIFVNTKDFSELIYKNLRKQGFKVSLIKGDQSPEERDSVIDQFRKGHTSFLITTNLLARGIDIP